MKKINPQNYEYIILQLLMLLPIFICGIGLICDFNQLKYIILFTGLIYLGFGYIPQMLNFSSIFIKFDNNYLYVQNQAVSKKQRVQFETKIFFNDIVDISIIGSFNNSLDQPIYKIGYGNLRIKKYLKFTLTNGKEKRIWIDYYKKEQIIFLLNHIKKYINIDIEKILSSWFSTNAEYKSK